jgi:hypothetical protein
MAKQVQDDVFREYAAAFFDDKTIKNLHYNATTSDI